MGEYLSGRLDIDYPSDIPPTTSEIISLVKIEADESVPRRFLVAFNLSVAGVGIPVMVLMYTGAMSNFMDVSFARSHRLKLTRKKIPVQCVGYDGSKNPDGLVTHEWSREFLAADQHGIRKMFSGTFNIAKLGNQDMIIGFPWMKNMSTKINLSNTNSYLEFEDVQVSAVEVIGGDLSVVLCEDSPTLSTFSVSLPPPTAVRPNQHDTPQNIASIPSPPKPDMAESLLSSLPSTCAKYLHVFSPQNSVLPPHRLFDCAIELKPNCDPPFGGLYNLALDEQQALKSYLNDLLRKGFIRASKSSAAAPIFFHKVPGKKDRPCVDYRGLNKITKRDSYPIPVMSWLLNQLKGCKFFAKIDLKAAFNLLRVKEGDEWKTAFQTPWGLFEYTVMPFGLANAPACFQRFIKWVLREYVDVFCFVYLDDILIFSKTKQEHEEQIEKVLKALSENKLTASAEKCEFFKTEVVFFGFVISTTGISMDPRKLLTLSEWPYPKNIADLRKFLGFSNFYRRFIPRFSHVVSKLTDLTGSKANVEEGLNQRLTKEAFITLRKLFASAPFLLHFDFAKPRVIQVDASAYAVSGILSQHSENGDLRPVAYYSRKLSPTEQRWQVHDQELGAIVFCFQEWRAWLMGSEEPTILLSDHANLRYFMRPQSLKSRQARWASFLSEFHFDILHTPGKDNPAYPASRRSDYTTGGLESSRVTLLGVRETENTSVMSISLLHRQPRNIVDHSSFMPPTNDTLDTIRSFYHSDETLQGKKPSFLTFDSGTWWWRDRIYVPEGLRDHFIRAVHAPPAAGHWGVAKTFDLLTRSFNWANARVDLLRFISSCVSCQQVKVNRRLPQGKLIPLPIPDRPW